MYKITDKIIKKFLKNLSDEGKSQVSVKNYKSDISHFLAWGVLKIKSFGAYAESVAEVIPFIDNNFFSEYKNYMTENKINIKTANRRLSSLRNFSRYLFSEHLIDHDFMNGIRNIEKEIDDKMQIKNAGIIEKFKESLVKDEKISPNTIKNYISDVKNFLNWVDSFEKA